MRRYLRSVEVRVELKQVVESDPDGARSHGPGVYLHRCGRARDVQKLEQLIDYAPYIPGMGVPPSGAPGQSFVIIRGIQPLTEASAVTYYLDDTPIGGSGLWANTFSQALDLQPYDLERFEVLRGPQGTLHGAGSQIGMIKYVSKQANVSDFEAHVGADLSTIHAASKIGESIRAMVNAPLVKGLLGVRLSAYDSYTPGYIDNLYSGAKGVNVSPVRGAHCGTLAAGRIALGNQYVLATDRSGFGFGGEFPRSRERA